MTVYTVRDALLWCFIINMGVLLWWFLMFIFAHNWIYRFHSKWFKISIEQFDFIHYQGMAFYKLAIFFFNLIPFLVLFIVQ
jgi:hypothetical protein